MEVFMSEDVSKILWKKLVVVIGDSIQRCVYKDLVCLLSPGSNTRYLTSKELKAKGEIEFLNDKLLQGGQLSDIKTGIHYREVRQYDSGTSVVKFYFVTRCYSDHLESVLNELKAMQPHAVIMNSCLWDLHRYGPRGPDSYHINMKKLMDGLKRVIPNDAVFIWNSTLPLDSKCKGGFLLPYFESIPAQEIIEANFVAADIVRSYGFIFLDLHSIFVHQLYHRAKDGIHWNHFAHRRITNLLLLNLCREWNLPVPKRMPLEIPREPRLHPLAERPHNASFGSYTSHLHVDRYGFGPSGAARYVAQQPISYKDRFRLMGSPITPSSTVVSNNNQRPSPIISDQNPDVKKENGLFSTPMYTSSPVEAVSKTKSYLQQNESTSNLCSPLDEAPFNQKLGLSPNLQHEFEDSSLGERDSCKKILEYSSANTISAPCFLNASRTQSTSLTTTSLTSTASQTSSLVIQVSSTCAAGRENSMAQKQPSTCTSTINPALTSTSRSQPSQFTLPAIQVMSAQVTKATPSQATKTAPCYNERSTVSALLNRVDVPTSHVSRVTIPVNQGMSSQVTKTTTSTNQHVTTTCTSMCGYRPKLSTFVISSVPKTAQSTGKENVSCTTGNSIPSLAGALSAKKQPVTTTERPSQQRENIPVIDNQEKNPSNTQSQKILHAVRSCAIQANYKLCADSNIVHLTNKPSNNRDPESGQVVDKTKAIAEASPTKRKISVREVRRKASDDAGQKKQKLPERACSSSSGRSQSEAEKSSSERAASTNLHKVSSGGQKRRAADDGESRNTKQRKVSDTEKAADSIRKPSSDLKRKAPSENNGNENVRQTHDNLLPPLAKRRKDERDNSNTAQQHPMRNALSGEDSTRSSTNYSSIPVHSRNLMGSRSVPSQEQSVPSHNSNQGNCYWTGTQQSLQDIQQQQMWFNTLLSRGRGGAYANNTQQSMFYNYYTRSWQTRQVYYHYHNYRY